MKPSIHLLQESEIPPQRFFTKLFTHSYLSRLRFINRRNIQFIILWAYLLANYACVKEVPITEGHGTQLHEETDVYVAGNYQNALTISTKPGFVAAYWKNGNYIPLTDGLTIADARSIAATRHDVYVAGVIGNQAAFWVNGNYIKLTDGKAPSVANSIFLSGNDIYVGGSEGSMAKYWMNGKVVTLGEGSITSIFVERNNVYAAGQNGNNEGGYWKNGDWIPILDVNGNRMTFVSSIVVEGHDVYVAGAVIIGKSGETIATYWKNGVPIYLDDPTSPYFTFGSFAHSIALSGKDIYVCGSGVPYGSVAVYWKNGVLTFLPGIDAGSDANSIAISGNDVYIAGFDFNPALSQAALWKNGVHGTLFGQPGNLTTQARANCVFILKSDVRDDHEIKYFQGNEKY